MLTVGVLVGRDYLESLVVSLEGVSVSLNVQFVEEVTKVTTRLIGIDKNLLAAIRYDRLSHSKRYRKPVGPVSSIQPIP